MSEELHPIRHISKAQNNSFRRKTTSMHTMHYVLCHGNRQCDKKFNVTHKLGHTRERPHSCNSCEKAFSQINSLKCHILSHTGENAPSVENLLVESRSWRDRNLKFGPNCDLEVDNLEKNKKFGEAKPSQIFYFFPNYPPPDHNLWAKF